jgi:hypothetical protein
LALRRDASAAAAHVDFEEEVRGDSRQLAESDDGGELGEMVDH